VFPLQTALGYELAQTLFVGPDCLLVEGPSDLLYFQVLSQACESAGLTGLESRWVVTPVGGADKRGTFVSLLGANQLNVATLVDANPKDRQRIAALQDNGHAPTAVSPGSTTRACPGSTIPWSCGSPAG
jgi:hypothetical protein